MIALACALGIPLQPTCLQGHGTCMTVLLHKFGFDLVALTSVHNSRVRQFVYCRILKLEMHSSQRSLSFWQTDAQAVLTKSHVSARRIRTAKHRQLTQRMLCKLPPKAHLISMTQSMPTGSRGLELQAFLRCSRQS